MYNFYKKKYPWIRRTLVFMSTLKKKCVLYAGIYGKYCSFLLNRLPEGNKEQTKECYQF